MKALPVAAAVLAVLLGGCGSADLAAAPAVLPVPTASVAALVPVPDVVGSSLAQAATTMAGAGLQFTVLPQGASGDAVVTHQSPAAGDLIEVNRSVQVWALPWLDDPEGLVGISIADAAGRLDSLVQTRQSLLPRTVQQWLTEPNPLPVADDSAYVASPATDCQDPRTVCTITVAVQAKVPDVRGSTVQDADQAVQGAGLVLQTTGATGDPEAAVDEQAPAAGRLADFGTVVSVVLRTATTPAPVAGWPPDVTGRWLDEALADLRAAEDERAGTVPALQIVLDPADIAVPQERAWVAAQSDDCAGGRDGACRVTLTLRAVVPDLANLTLTAARDALAAAGLVLGEVQGPQTGEARVSGQEPTDGTVVGFGSGVTVTLAAASGFDPWWVAIGLLGLAMLGAAAAGVRAAAHRRGRPWVRQHVRAEAVPGPGTQNVAEVPGGGATHTVEIVPEEGTAVEQVEEVDER